jgi:hypothetical protein
VEKTIQGHGDGGGGALRERRKQAEAVEEYEEAAEDGADQARVESVAQHGELGMVRVVGVLPGPRRRAIGVRNL